jgi:DNA-binding NarL/FixJ family response regulator
MAVVVGGEDSGVPVTAAHVGTDKSIRWRESPSRHQARRFGDDSPPIPLLTRRAPLHPSSLQVVACLELVTVSDGRLSEHDRACVHAVAVRRIQRSIRPGDRIRLSDGLRLAVCFGPVADGTEPARLGARLARAVGDRLTVGNRTIDLDVSVGVAVGDGGCTSAELIESALHSIPVRADGAVVGMSSRTLDAAGTELARATALDLVRAEPNGWAPTDGGWSTGGSVPARLTPILVVDCVPGEPGTAGVKAHAVGSCLGSAGLVADLVAPRTDDDIPARTEPGTGSDGGAIVLLVVHPGSQRRSDHVAARAWEQPATLARAYHQAGATVVVVSVGAAAAALAACIEQGAASIIDIEDLPSHADLLARALRAGELRVEGASGPRTAWARSVHDDHIGLEPLMQLTPSERKVLYHLTTGSSASEIAGLLVVSIATVRSHIRSILRKLEVGSQLAAVAIARGDHLDVAIR